MKLSKRVEKQNTEIKKLSPDLTTGLNSDDVKERVNAGLSNKVSKNYSKSYLNIFVNNICTFFNLLGVIVCIALIIAKAQLSSFFFVLIYLANIFIGIIQEIRAKVTIDKLSLVANKVVKVIRCGKLQEISPDEIVRDDLIVLKIGNQVPTDSIIAEGEVEINESLLTGESVPVKKHAGDTVLAGSFIISGSCKVIADKVGKDNYVEMLSEKAKKYKKPNSELINSLKLIIKIVGAIIIPIAIAYVAKALLLGANYPDAIKSTSTVVIGMIPSGMFLLTSLTLAVGIIKLAKHNTLVQDLYSLEMLARVDTICFDKTGTITDGKMTVKDFVLLDENTTKDEVKTVMGSMIYSLKDNNQTAIALYNYFGENTYLTALNSVPFNSSRKLSAVSFAGKGTYCFGAPEFVLDRNVFESLENRINTYALQGLRVLILAHSDVTMNGDNDIPTDFTPLAIILIVDNIRSDAPATVAWFKENGVAIKVISGDNPITVSEVSKRVGIENADKYLSLEGMSDEEVAAAANEYTVFGRVSPEQKAILIKAIKNAGHVTAMTGDGVNDLLALKEADCAISVASGSDAARNISHLVLMDNNFNSMPQIVYEGRRVINNVQGSASLYLIKTLFTILLSIIIFLVPFIPKYPFELPHMILLEVFVIGLPSFFLSLQPNDSRIHGKFLSVVLAKSLPSALIMVFSVLVVLFAEYLLHLFPTEIYITMAVTVMTLAGVFSLFNICRPINAYRGILFTLNAAMIVAALFYALIHGLPFLGLFPLYPLEIYWHHVLIVLVLVLLDIILFIPVQKLCKRMNIEKVLEKNKMLNNK